MLPIETRISSLCRSLAVLLAALFVGGCGGQPVPSTTRSAADADPQTKFEAVMERLRRAYNDSEGPRRLIADDVGERATLQYHYDITYEVHEPPRSDEPYTAEVTVQTTTHYTVRSRSTPPAEEKPGGDDELLNAQANPGEAPLDQPPDKQPADDPGGYESNLRTDHFIDTYDLAYEQGRWALKTHVTDESVKLAFDYALKDQPGAPQNVRPSGGAEPLP